MPYKSKQTSTSTGSKPHQKGRQSDRRNDESRSPKANTRSPVTKGQTHPDQRRAAFEVLRSKNLKRRGGVEQALTIIENSMSRLQALGTNYREEQRYAVAYCYGLAQHFADDAQAWAAFCKNEFWRGYKDGPEKTDSSDALRFVLLWAVGRKGKAASKHVSRLHIAVRPFFDEVPASELPNRIIDGGGFAKLAAKHVMNPKRKTPDGTKEPRVVLRARLGKEARHLRTLGTLCRVFLTAEIKAWNGDEANITIFGAEEIHADEDEE